ncbi:MAG: hypothetical protein IPN79_12115 [Saprospiraceae bacterium]|nr:hypothetical protein [Saprospiraceae bacterium]
MLDASASNEIQTLSISGQNLTLSGIGGTVELPMNMDFEKHRIILQLKVQQDLLGLEDLETFDYQIKVTGDFSCTGNARADEIFGEIIELQLMGLLF